MNLIDTDHRKTYIKNLNLLHEKCFYPDLWIKDKDFVSFTNMKMFLVNWLEPEARVHTLSWKDGNKVSHGLVLELYRYIYRTHNFVSNFQPRNSENQMGFFK